jgi:acyl transferase domain-containing protein/NAD(P)H-dependent flavin oxidoreductase YrpB (nitropropane dioxygenase family)/NAD(P)-dependent dehydrogenase (short-subunit alcohol dehydrogenase family)
MSGFTKLVYTPAGLLQADVAICASRAGGVGILNAELSSDMPAILAALEALATHTGGHFGLKVDAWSQPLSAAIHAYVARGLSWLIVEAGTLVSCQTLISGLRSCGVRVLGEITTADWSAAVPLTALDGLIVKGNEAGGFVGEESTFILLQKWLKRSCPPLYLRGGLTPQVAAGCAALGIVGGVLDSQLLLMDEVRVPGQLRRLIGNLAGSETVTVGHPERGQYFRLLVRPALGAARQFVAEADNLGGQELRPRVLDRATWSDPGRAILPVGQDVAFAGEWRKRFGSVAAVLGAIDMAVATYPGLAQRYRSIAADAPLARALGTRLPIIQGPMTRVSDTAQFARVIADNGALPMVALAVMKGAALEQLLRECAVLLGERPWGVGLLGFAPQELLDEQLRIVGPFKPTYAIIAGGRPDQAVHLERLGIPSFLHVPAANLIPLFLQDGARRFIFEGRECGGHIGPLSSFVLWSSMIDRLLVELPACKVPGEQVEVIFAGGIHDALSCALLQIMAAPLAAAGVKIGILMGSAYLFTREIVTSGAVVGQFQKEVLDCQHTVNLESGVGHASRCAYSPFAHDFFQKRAALRSDGVPADETRQLLDELILGRLRIASKGLKRAAQDSTLQTLTAEEQHGQGMYMLGQVATLRDTVTDVDTLHQEVTAQAAALIDSSVVTNEPPDHSSERPAPADIAVIGMACALPKATNPGEFWDNIVSKVDAITEIPRCRWDWRLYYDPDRNAPDKVYSKWGGFLDDIPFDPLAYGMPPKSIEAVDPMQLMGLEIARRTLMDSGYHNRPFDRERAAVILGVSGGIGDVGMQYGLRSELPRFSGKLPEDIAKRLPSWTEDSFAGILPNVAAGRIANRLNFGGMNMTTDAACASSLAAIYQAVTELTAGRSDFVIAGGLDTVQGPFGYLCFSKTQALSPRGKCSTFDASGDGIVISEGIAMLALKRLADAERDGDRIYAVIKGVGSSSDGNAKGLTAPLPAGQLRAMRRAYQMAGFDPSSVGLFEAHGTGTVAGDSAELESTTQLIREHSHETHQAVIGSVKTMIGHTKATAGAAGLMKAILALHHRVLPPHNNLTKPIEALSDTNTPVYVLGDAMPWLHNARHPRRAACSAFGFGGTNFHAVLEEHVREYRPWLRPPASRGWSAELLVWSGADQTALLSKVEAFAHAIERLDGFQLRDLAASLAQTFQSGVHTLAIVARSVSDLRTKLGLALARLRKEASSLPPGMYVGNGADRPGKVAVLFPGQGSQYPNMAREPAVHFDAVRDTLARADSILSQAFAPGFTLSRFIFPRGCYDEAAQAQARRQLASTDVAQPALGAVETGLFQLLHSLGLRADMFAGHSYGEFVALYAGGAIDLESLLRLSAARGRFIIDAASEKGTELGTMAAVDAARELIEQEIAGVAGVVLANHNAPTQSVISGPRAAVQAAVARLREIEVEVTEIPVAAAFHSSLVKPAQQALGALIEATDWSAVSVPVYSNTSGRPHSGNPGEVKRQMTDHLVRPVEFVAEVEAMYADGARIFVEIGPKSVLTRLVGRILGERPHVAIGVDDGSGLAGLLGGMGQMLCAGIHLDINSLFASRDCRLGDPTRPETVLRHAELSKHAWLLNGSAAHRADMPAPQVGVTREQTESAAVPVRPAALTANEPALHRPVASTGIGRSPRPPEVLTTIRRKALPMDDRRTSDFSMTAEYFATMRQFLETQERVMEALLAADGAARAPMRSQVLAINGTRSAQLAAAPVITPTARAYVPIPSAAAPPPPRLTEPIVAAPPPAATPTAMAVPSAPSPASHKNNGVPASSPVLVGRPAQNAAGSNGASRDPPASAAADELSRDKLLNSLLGIVEEKTGYPRDMLGLDQNLEADLGIDSIKRVEVVGAFLKLLPEELRDALARSGAKLSSKSTLNGMLDLLAQSNGPTETARPFDSAGMGTEADDVGHPSRLIMRAQREPLTAEMGRRLTPGQFVVTRDALGVADVLAETLRARGVPVLLIDCADLTSDHRVIEMCLPLRTQSLGGIVHLAALGARALSPEHGPAEWRTTLQVNEKSLFLLLHELQASLVEGAHIVAASGLGGLFGRDGASRGELQLQGGAPGMLKSLLQERGDLRVKAVDLDPQLGAAVLSGELMGEIELDGGRQEVGYPSGERTLFRTEGAKVCVDATRDAQLKSLVVLATGGLRGITAETLRELAQPGNILILTGRSTLPEAESADTAAFADPESLRGYYVAQVRSGAVKMTPGDIQRRVQSILGMREMLANLADFRAAGATAHYYNVDVTDEAALSRLIREIEQRYQRIDGVVHGAGVIEDKLLVDKSSDSWSRVVETKVFGLLLLQKLLNPNTLKFFTVFSSVAGRYGNSGQADYAAANELMNRICVALQARWGNSVVVSALCWGPWGPTKFGSGMVTTETEAKFKERGVSLVSAALGRRLFRQELARQADSPVEVICGEGPWESEETKRGALRAAGDSANPQTLPPLFANAAVTTSSSGKKTVSLQFESSAQGPAIGLLAEAARLIWPQWHVVQVRELRVLKSLEPGVNTLHIQLSPPPYGSSAGFEVSASVQSEAGQAVQTNFQCVLGLHMALPAAPTHARTDYIDGSPAISKAYTEWPAREGRSRTIEKIDGFSARGASASVRATQHGSWPLAAGVEGQWLFDPGLLDAAAQIVSLWTRHYLSESVTPKRYGQITRYQERLPARMRMEFKHADSPGPEFVRGDVVFFDEQGHTVLDIEELDCTLSAAGDGTGHQAGAAAESART